jgi:hypothetical protein
LEFWTNRNHRRLIVANPILGQEMAKTDADPLVDWMAFEF